MAVPHQITLIAYGTDGSAGTRTLVDIVDTSFRNASYFARRWMRDPEVTAISACRPGSWNGTLRNIQRQGS